MITIETAPRQRNRFWRSPAVTSITLTPGRVPGGHRLPLSTWQRSYGQREDPPARAGRSKR